MRFLRYFLVFTFLIMLVFFLRKNDEHYQVISGQTMGTFYSIKIKTLSDNSKLPEMIKKELVSINKQMSVFDPDSEISKINKTQANEWVELSQELSLVMKSAYKTYELSKGAFDPTVGNIINLWGFGTDKEKKIPSDRDIKETLSTSGFNKIVFSEDFTKLKKTNEEISVNLSAIAKGYGVDRLAEVIKNAGYNDFVVEIGGEVYASGKKSIDVQGWNVGIVRPIGNYSENALIVTLNNTAIATSGNYRNFFFENGKRYSHTISPTNGYPVESDLVSVTVFGQTCMEADAIATSLMSMGDKKAISFAEKNNIAAIFFLHKDENSVKIAISPNAKQYIGN